MQKSLPLPFCHKVEKTLARKRGEYPGTIEMERYSV